MNCVLDASAVLVLLNREPGADLVAEAIEGAYISAVNLAEVASKHVENGGDTNEIAALVDWTGMHVVPFDEDQALTAGALRASTRALGLSLGDRACLAAALFLRPAAVLTADRAWAGLDLGIDIRVVR